MHLLFFFYIRVACIGQDSCGGWDRSHRCGSHAFVNSWSGVHRRRSGSRFISRYASGIQTGEYKIQFDFSIFLLYFKSKTADFLTKSCNFILYLNIVSVKKVLFFLVSNDFKRKTFIVVGKKKSLTKRDCMWCFNNFCSITCKKKIKC